MTIRRTPVSPRKFCVLGANCASAGLLVANKKLIGRPGDLTLTKLIVVRLRPLIGKAKKLLGIDPGKTLRLQVLH